MQKNKTFISLFALDVNSEFHYPKYFSMLPTARYEEVFHRGLFQVAAAQNPKPQTIALVAEDAEFSRNACEGARDNVKKYGLKNVYDKPIRRARPTSRQLSARSRLPIRIS